MSHPAPSPEKDVAPGGELILHNGRQAGTRRRLTGPLTLLGRAEGCDVRLNVDGVNPHHCALVHAPDGFHLRDLQSEWGTRVNGHRVGSCTLRDGDLLEVGPFQFLVRLPLNRAEQVEEKRRQLLALRDEAQKERAAMQRERAVYERRVLEVTLGLSENRRELADLQKGVVAKRERLARLRGWLRQRWHRQYQELESLAKALSGQRLFLAEQCERLLQAKIQWRQHQEEALAELTEAANRLQARERALEERGGNTIPVNRAA